MYCIDTDLAIGFLRNDAKAREFMKKIAGEKLAMTHFAVCELYTGAFLSGDMDDLMVIEDFIDSFSIIPQSRASCILFSSDFAGLRKKGKIIGVMDLLAASVCKAHGCTLVTRNIKDFQRVPDLKIRQW